MDGFNAAKKYKSYKIPGQQQFNLDGAAIELPQVKSAKPAPLDEGMYYEIEYDACPIPGVGKFVLKSQKITEPERDEKRDLFYQMRDIARTHHSAYDSSRFFDQRVQYNNSIIFYKQGMFMKDFTDDYSGNAGFTQYFPNYNIMGYEQLRTYFTWRTEVRKGNVADISLSYAFLYIYELLGNIGVNNPQDGLDKLMFFWKAFSAYNKSIDKYILRWLKDYHVYYELDHTFKDFIETNNLTGFYPDLVDIDNNFDLFCSISKYDIRKSAFFSKENSKLIADCFFFVINKLRQSFEDNGIRFEESIFQPTKKLSEWKPFKGALFHNWMKQADRRIVLSENEIYICQKNRWAFSSVITSENARQLIGYIMKQMEAALRRVTSYKHKLSANLSAVTHEAVVKLQEAGLSLEEIINDAVYRFYKEATKTVVVVDQEALARIRQEALVIQEKLIVPEQEQQPVPIMSMQEEQHASVLPIQDEQPVPTIPMQDKGPVSVSPIQEQLSLSYTAIQDMPSMPPVTPSSPLSDTWESLKNTLTKTEIEALSVVMNGEIELKRFADECGIMLEVLVDGINEKAMDSIGDSLLDEDFVIYDDYKEQVKELIGL
jgi:hypothetical protein